MTSIVSKLLSGLSQDVRRDIIKILDKNKSMQFSLLLKTLKKRHPNLSASNLSYHIGKLSGLIDKDAQGLYRLTNRGERINMLIYQLDTILSGGESDTLQIDTLDSMNKQIYDMFHKSILDQSDPIKALKIVEKIGQDVGEKISSAPEFDSFRDLEGYLQDGGALGIEQSLKKVGDLHVLASCPFSLLYARFLAKYGKLPESFAGIKREAEKRGYQGITCAFCVVHHNIRESMLNKVKDNQYTLYQLGCKSLTGERAIANADLVGISSDRISDLLEDYVCIYSIQPK